MGSTEISLIDILISHNVPDLKYMAKNLGIKGYSKLRKAELLEVIYGQILDAKTLQERFLVANDKEIKFLEEAIENKINIESDSRDYVYWMSLAFAFATEDFEIHIPTEIKEVYAVIKDIESYNENRRITTIIDEYATACTNLYEIIHVEKLIEIINKQTQINIEYEDVLYWCSISTQYKGTVLYFFKDGYVMDGVYDESEEYSRNYEDMLYRQADKPYYIPNKKELLKYVYDDYIDENKYFNDMVLFLQKQLKYNYERAYEMTSEIQIQIRIDEKPSEIIEFLTDEMGLEYQNERQVTGFFEHMMNMFNNTRISVNRGHTPRELSEIMGYNKEIPAKLLDEIKDMGFIGIGEEDTQASLRNTEHFFDSTNQQANNIIQFPGKPHSKKKTYPNDPCPCGSGLKYKMCCGKN